MTFYLWYAFETQTSPFERWRLLISLTLSNTIPNFNDPLTRRTFENIVGEKGENAGNQYFLLFHSIFSNLSKREICILATLNFSSANAFNLVRALVLSFGKELTHSHTMTPIDRSGKKAFWKHCGKRRNCLYKQFLLFPQCFLLYQRQKLSFLLHLIYCLQMLSIWTDVKFCCVVKS